MRIVEEKISIHSLRMEGDKAFQKFICLYQHISIHSLRMEGDANIAYLISRRRCISIHSLRMEGDGRSRRIGIATKSFQSTPSAWRETLLNSNRTMYLQTFQSTPSAWRETRRSVRVATEHSTFQSTPSAWRETHNWKPLPLRDCISIHSLRMEGDVGKGFIFAEPRNFNPLPPHGGRLRKQMQGGNAVENFNPLPPHGGRLLFFQEHTFRNFHFNPLPPHGGRRRFYTLSRPEFYFNPLPPHGGRLFQQRPMCAAPGISIHSLRMEGDIPPIHQRQ